MSSITSRNIVKNDKRDNKYLGKKVLFEVIKEVRIDNLIVKIKCNGYKAIIQTLSFELQKKNLNQKNNFCIIQYKDIIKDATIEYNIKFFCLKIWEILTLGYNETFQKNNEEILKVYILNKLNTDILQMRFIDYIKTDYLLSNKDYNIKYKFSHNSKNKYLFENKFNGKQKPQAKNLIQQDLLEYLYKKKKRPLKKEKKEFESSKIILQLLKENTREETIEINRDNTPFEFFHECEWEKELFKESDESRILDFEENIESEIFFPERLSNLD